MPINTKNLDGVFKRYEQEAFRLRQVEASIAAVFTPVPPGYTGEEWTALHFSIHQGDEDGTMDREKMIEFVDKLIDGLGAYRGKLIAEGLN